MRKADRLRLEAHPWDQVRLENLHRLFGPFLQFPFYGGDFSFDAPPMVARPHAMNTIAIFEPDPDSLVSLGFDTIVTFLFCRYTST